MKLSARFFAGFALLILFGSTVGCNKLRARDQLVKGIQAFKAGQYEQAIDRFQNSVALDPNDPTTRLYLATAYSYQVVPNLDTPENLAIAQKAMNGFNEVLAKNPNDLDALKQIASIQRNIKQFDAAKATEQKIISLDPKDAEANYTIGVIDWTQAYKNAVQILGEQGLQDDGDGNVKMNKATCAKMKAANTQLVNEAMDYFQRAIKIRPNYDDAMSYLNLDYRRKADLDCPDDAARKADLALADEWVQKSIGARKANEAAKEKAEGGGITMQNNH
ncbi:MAG TPA: tetratricopeptide repeat protein [Candidatus Aquilonibacter sp.]|nr:tetratricopeptide repeat protein [Candidatus Aquilonibacter sp.]